MALIHVGTSSWSDFTGFYPPGLPANAQVSYYAQHFTIVELNSTFYRLMPARNAALWAQRTPPGFSFDVKPYRQLTWHDRESPPTPEVAAQFSASLEPLRAADKLGALHFQMPPWFTYSPDNLAYLESLRAKSAWRKAAVTTASGCSSNQERFTDATHASGTRGSSALPTASITSTANRSCAPGRRRWRIWPLRSSSYMCCSTTTPTTMPSKTPSSCGAICKSCWAIRWRYRTRSRPSR